MNQERYIEEIGKYCDPFSMLVIGDKGQLMRIYCPFPAMVIQPVGNLEKGDVVYVSAVKVTLELKDVYIIKGKAYYIIHFKIIM